MEQPEGMKLYWMDPNQRDLAKRAADAIPLASGQHCDRCLHVQAKEDPDFMYPEEINTEAVNQ